MLTILKIFKESEKLRPYYRGVANEGGGANEGLS